MKLLFVTGGDECVCKGKGWIEQPVWVTATVSVVVRTQCKCVEAHEATVEELVDHGVHKTTERSGSVVPKEG